MSYISWLLEKLREEINFDSPDVYTLLSILRRCACLPEVRARYDAMANAWAILPRNLARPFILLQTQLMDNRQRDRLFQENLNALNRNILLHLFSEFIQTRVFKIVLEK